MSIDKQQAKKYRQRIEELSKEARYEMNHIEDEDTPVSKTKPKKWNKSSIRMYDQDEFDD